MKYCAFLWFRYFETDDSHSHSDRLMEASRSALAEAEGVLQKIRTENEIQYLNILSGRNYLLGCSLRFTYC